MKINYSYFNGLYYHSYSMFFFFSVRTNQHVENRNWQVCIECDAPVFHDLFCRYFNFFPIYLSSQSNHHYNKKYIIIRRLLMTLHVNDMLQIISRSAAPVQNVYWATGSMYASRAIKPIRGTLCSLIRLWCQPLHHRLSLQSGIYSVCTSYLCGCLFVTWTNERTSF